MTPERRLELLAASRLGRLVAFGTELPRDAVAPFADPAGAKGDLDPEGHWRTISGNAIHITRDGEIDAGGHPALRAVLEEKAGLTVKGKPPTQFDPARNVGNTSVGGGTSVATPEGRTVSDVATPTPLAVPTDGGGVPSGMTFLGESKRNLPIFRDGAGTIHVRGKKGLQEWSGEPFDAAKHVKVPSTGQDDQNRLAAEREAELAALRDRKRAEVLAAEAKEAVEREKWAVESRRLAAEAEAARQARATERETRIATANHLDFYESASDPHTRSADLPAGKARLTVNSVNLRPGYVAKLVGKGGRHEYEREFLTAKGAKGKLSAVVGDGVYEVENAENVKGRGGRSYVVVENGLARIVSGGEAATLVADSPAEVKRKANLARPATAPVVNHTVTGEKPAVGDLVMRGDTPLVIEAVGRSRFLSRDLLDDMDDFGVEPHWQTDVTARPVAWQHGDPETATQRATREGREKLDRQARIEAAAIRRSEYDGAVTEAGGFDVPPDVTGLDLSKAEKFGGTRYDDTALYLHPDGNLYRVVYNGRDGDDWSYNNWSGGSSVVTRVRATPRVIAAVRASYAGSV